MSDEQLKVVVTHYDKPEPFITKPFLFQEGQEVRIKVGVSEDGITPSFWDGARGFINDEGRHCAGHTRANRTYWYSVQHANLMAVCTFKESDLDFRFVRGKRLRNARRKRSKRVA